MSAYPEIRGAPYDAQAERALVGAALIDPALAGELRWVSPEMFYLQQHRWVWETVAGLQASSQAVDFVTVTSALEGRGKLEEIGGAAYLVRLMTETPNSAYAESYARIVAREHQRRRALEYAAAVARAAYGDGESALDAVLARGPELAAASAPDHLAPSGEIAEDIWPYIVEPERLGERMVSTGLSAWDETLGGGLERGTATFVMARPAMGKTALLCQLSDFVSRYTGPVAFFSKEMNARQILLRMAARRARVSVLAWRQRRLDDEARGRLLSEIGELASRQTLWIDDSTPQTTDEVRAACERLARQAGPLALVVADHLRLFADRAENENKRAGAIAWGFKCLAKALDVPVLAAAQLNRGVEVQGDKRPDLKDLRDSGEIEENADTVTALYRESYYNTKADCIAELINRKAREGERNARAQFAFIAEHMSFEPLSRLRPS